MIEDWRRWMGLKDALQLDDIIRKWCHGTFHLSITEFVGFDSKKRFFVTKSIAVTQFTDKSHMYSFEWIENTVLYIVQWTIARIEKRELLKQVPKIVLLPIEWRFAIIAVFPRFKVLLMCVFNSFTLNCKLLPPKNQK